MKKMLNVLIAMSLLVACTAVAQEAVAPAGADIITSILNFLQSIPKVGNVIVFILQYMGIVAVVLTVISAILAGVKKVLALLAKPESTVLNKIVEIIDKVYPYVAYLSMANVQKKA